jgi:D-alanyl-D-alanine carboxypeptidase
MTVMVVLDAQQSKDEIIKLDWTKAIKYHTRLPRTVKSLTRDDLIDLAIVKSDNFAAYTLCANYPGGTDMCISAMNHKAQELNMANTRFVDPTGLEEENVSNATDLVRMVMVASTYLDITDASSKPKVSIEVKKHWWEFKNTNPLVKSGNDIHVSKTGYIGGASGGCIVMYLETDLGPRIVVLLGSHNTHTRIEEAENIILTVTSTDIKIK